MGSFVSLTDKEKKNAEIIVSRSTSGSRIVAIGSDSLNQTQNTPSKTPFPSSSAISPVSINAPVVESPYQKGVYAHPLNGSRVTKQQLQDDLNFNEKQRQKLAEQSAMLTGDAYYAAKEQIDKKAQEAARLQSALASITRQERTESAAKQQQEYSSRKESPNAKHFVEAGKNNKDNVVEYSRANWEKLAYDESKGIQSTAFNGNGWVKSKYRSIYRHMTDEEVNTYNYILGKDGAEAADAYLLDIEEAIAKREGEAQAKHLEGMGGIAKGIYGMAAGSSNALEGMRQNRFEDALATGAMQFGSQKLRENMSGLGGVAYDLSYQVGNMLPSMIVSTALGGSGLLAKGAASAYTGFSAKGNAYNQAIKDGYSKEQAQNYSTLIGASEGILQYLLSGIGKLGGVTDDILLAKVKGIDNAFAKLALTGLIKAGSEVAEEELQLIIEPTLRSLILNEEFNAPTWNDVAYTALLSALSVGAMEGAPNAIAKGYDFLSNTAQDIKNKRGANPLTPATGNAPEATTDALEINAPQIAENEPQTMPTEEAQKPAKDPLIDAIMGGKRVDSNKLSNESFQALDQRGDVTIDAKGNAYLMTPEQHIDQRDYESVGKRNVNAFQFDHPELHNHMAAAAQDLLNDAAYSLDKGKTIETVRTVNGKKRYQRIAENRALRRAMDEVGLSRNQIIKAAQDLVADNGQENYAAAKRLELILDEMLTKGYSTLDGKDVPPNEAYIKLKSKVVGSTTPAKGSFEAYVEENRLSLDLGEVTMEQLREEYDSQQAPQFADDGVGARNNQYKSGQAVSKAKSPWEAGQKVSPKERLYDVTSDEERLNIAQQRLELDYNGEKEYLRSAPEWNGEDINVAHMIQSDLFAEAQKTGDFKEFRDWQKMVKRHSSSFGADLQMLKHWAKRNAESVTSDAASILDEAKEAGAASGGKQLIMPEMIDATLGDIAYYGQMAEALDNAGDADGMYDLVLDVAKHRGYKPSKAVRNALKTCTMEELQDVMWSEIHGIAVDAIPPTLGRQISTYQYLAQLLNAKTLLRNITSNSVLAPVEGLFTNNIAAVVDLVSSAAVGKAQGITTRQARTVGFENPFSKDAFAGAKRGIQQSAIDVSLDIGRGNAENKYEVNTNRTFNRYAGDGFWNAVKNIPNTLEGALGYGLNVTDEMQKGATDASVRQSLSKLAGTEGGRITQEMVDDFAKREQLYRSVQRETAIGKLLQGGKDILNTIGIGTSNGKKNWLGLPVKDFGLGDFINKYSRVPGAIATTLIEYTDLGMAKAIYNLYAMTYANIQINAGRSNAEVQSGLSGYEGMTNEETAVYAQRAFAQNIARVLTGKGLMAAFVGLAKLGILSFTDDEDKDEAAVKRGQGLGGLQINLSALGRLLSGESGEMQDQDVLADINSLEPINGLAQIGAELAAMEDGATSKDKLDATAQSVIDGFTDLSMMQNLGSVVDTFSYKDEDETWGETFGKAGLGLLTNSVSGFVPAPVRQAAQFFDPYYRDAYSGSEAEKVGNAAKSPIPVLREQLPTSLTPLGEERKKTTSGALDFFTSFISPFNITRYQQSDVVDEMERTGVYVSRNSPKTLESDGVKTELTAEQRRQHQISKGAALTATVGGLMGSHSYQNAGEAAQKEMMADARSYANDVAKAAVLGDKAVDEWVIRARDSGMPEAYIQYKHFADGKKSQADTAKALEKVQGISDTQRGKIWSAERNEDGRESTEAKNPFTGAMPQAGISSSTAIDILAEYSKIDKSDLKDRDKPAEFKKYVRTLGLDPKQMRVVGNIFPYFGSYPIYW